MLNFVRKNLCRKLSELPTLHEAAFAATCAEKLFPYYVEFQKEYSWGNQRLLREVLDKIWRVIEKEEEINFTEIDNLIKEVYPVIPDMDDFSSNLASFALNSGASVLQILSYFKSKNSDDIAYVGELMFDTIDFYLREKEGLDYTFAEGRQKIMEHPLMQKELQRQEDAITFLSNTPVLNKEAIEKLKSL